MIKSPKMRNETTGSPKGANNNKAMRPFTCEVCGVKFFRKGHLTVHMRIHSVNKRYPCEYCDAKFTQKGSYLAHLEMHTEPQGYFCPVCDKRYAHRSSLDSHMRSHGSNPQYICPVCGTHFTYKDELDMHMKTHPERRVVASSAGAARCSSSGAARTLALNTSHLSRVPQAIFMDERIMACDVCGSRFTNERALLAHKRFHKRRPNPKKIGPRKKKRRRLSFNTTMEAEELEDDIIQDQDTVEFMGIVADDDDDFVQDINDVGELHLSL